MRSQKACMHIYVCRHACQHPCSKLLRIPADAKFWDPGPLALQLLHASMQYSLLAALLTTLLQSFGEHEGAPLSFHEEFAGGDLGSNSAPVFSCSSQHIFSSEATMLSRVVFSSGA